jgi:hypothetical protein
VAAARADGLEPFVYLPYVLTKRTKVDQVEARRERTG